MKEDDGPPGPSPFVSGPYLSGLALKGKIVSLRQMPSINDTSFPDDESTLVSTDRGVVIPAVILIISLLIYSFSPAPVLAEVPAIEEYFHLTLIQFPGNNGMWS